MDVSMKLDSCQAIFSNGDTVYGNVVVYCPATITLAKVTASLAGECTTSLIETSGILIKRKLYDRQIIVQDTNTIIPYSHSFDSPKHEPIRLGFGYHSFPFGLQVPWFIDPPACPPNSPIFQSIHEKRPKAKPGSRELPPSLSGRVKGVEISYRITIAVTIIQHMFKSTIRRTEDITVWPLDTRSLPSEPPCPVTYPSISEVQASILGPAVRLPDIQTKRNALVLPPPPMEPTHILITSRLPPSFSLTCRKEIQMHLSIQSLTPPKCNMYLQSFQMLLLGFTDIRAQRATHTEVSFWMIQSLSNLHLPMFSQSDNVNTEKVVDSALWKGKKLEDSVVPTFQTRNVSRRYELEILMGFQLRDDRSLPKKARMVFVQLRTPVHLGSGIWPGRMLSIENKSGDCGGDIVTSTHQYASRAYSDVDVVQGGVFSPGEAEITYDVSPLGTPPAYEEAVGAIVPAGFILG
ncbi:hypothetical protein P154DRAFT_576704 [Amniculicola lignicola CBS 123094]|uniref:Arrestin-like N-terminal domain-containing protein n=1 Tax=Amniculicola lignicola CBS 123094 TaxID=1392246 RepID=A0A6A5WL12_9PLEO|nr:hypothetical protein P154DRAFT_576704 [Amniculicola lignicola CBS 123094]